MTPAVFVPSKPNGQLLKWIGSKYKYAHEIVSHFPDSYETFIEPFIGTGAILATLSPDKAIAGDTLSPLIDLWQLIQREPETLINYYSDVIPKLLENKEVIYRETLARYNANPNPCDLLIISRTCYGGVIRFTKQGTISTPVGPHKPIPPESFAQRAFEWQERVQFTRFINQPFTETMNMAKSGDLIYCDPPYVDSQAILYGAQSFKLPDLIESIIDCKDRGAKVALSIDGHKKSGKKVINLGIPEGLFEREILIGGSSSMLKRFQNGGEVMIGEDVKERLLLTW